MKINILKKKQLLFILCCLITILSVVGGLHAFADNNSDLKLEYKFANATKGSAAGTIELTATSSNTGSYTIYWANDNGKLSEYNEITTIDTTGTNTKSYTVASLNAIPENANKIVAIKDNVVRAEYKIDSSKLINDTKKFSFGALSDIHLEGGSNDESNSKSDFDNELNYFKSQNVAFLGNSGDITRDGKSEDIDAVVNKIKSFGLPVYTARGNHDTRNACASNWEKIEPNGTCFEKVINGEVFIFMGLDKEDYTNPFTSDQISKLKEMLAKYKDKRVFLFEHVFIGSVGNVNGLYPYSSLSDSGTAGEFKKLLSQYKNIITFTGHTHLDFNLQRLNEFANVKAPGDDYGFRVHCPSASRPRRNDEGKSSSKTYTYDDGAYGYLVDVYDNYIILKGRDFVANKNIPYATYILVTNEQNPPTGSSGEQNTNSDIKLDYKFANNTKVNAAGTIELTVSSSNTGNYDIYWANDNGKLDDYEKITTIDANGTDTKSYKVAALNAIPKDATKIIAIKDDTVKAEYKINSSKLISGNKKFSFGALSDVHLDGDGDDSAHSIEDFQNELNYFKSQNVKFVANSGDITRDGRKEDLEAVVKRITEFGLPVYTARGNHDTNDACSDISEWLKIEPNGTIFEKVVDDEVFIFLGLNKYDYTNPFTSEQLTQLKTMLEKYKNKRVFMFEHIFVGDVGNVNGLYPYDKLSDDGTAGEFKKIMKENKNVILFTGHSHLGFDLQKFNEYANVKEPSGDYGYRVHCPSATRPRENDEGKDASKTYDNKEGALGYLVDVYDNYIVLTGRDFVANKNLPYATYVLVTNISNMESSTPNNDNNQQNPSTSEEDNKQHEDKKTENKKNEDTKTEDKKNEETKSQDQTSKAQNETKKTLETSISQAIQVVEQNIAQVTEQSMAQVTEPNITEDTITSESTTIEGQQYDTGNIYTNDASTSGSSSELEKSPKTSDKNNVIPIVIICIISVVVALGFYFRRKNSY